MLRSLLSNVILAACLFAQGPGSGNGPGKPTDPGNSGKGNTIQWLTTDSDIDQALLNTGKAKADFKSKVDLEDIQVWFTPSLSDVTANPAKFAKIAKDTAYTISLQMPQKPDHTLGGTLHLRSGSDDSRSYAAPLPLNVKVSGGSGGEQPKATVTNVVSSASGQNGPVTAGQTIYVRGSGIGPDQAEGLELDTNGRVATYLADTQVLFNGIPAPLLAASSSQVHAVVPQGVSSDSTVDIVLTFKGTVSATVTLPVKAASPALFTLDGSGEGQSAALNQDGIVNTSAQPADRGTIVSLFGSGFGEWSQPAPDGTIFGSTPPALKSDVSVTIGGVAAKVLYAGGAPGLVSGVVQIDAEIPAEITPGEKVTVVVTVGGQSSPANVTVSVD